MDENDLIYQQLNKELLEFAKDVNWPLYRNTCQKIAEFLNKEKRYELSLNKYLEVMWYDINGCQRPYPELYFYDEFNLDQSFIAPGIVKRIKILLRRLKIDIEDLNILYNNYVKKACIHPKAPLTHDEIWHKIKSSLEI